MNKLIPLKELFTPVYGVNLELVNVEECRKNEISPPHPPYSQEA